MDQHILASVVFSVSGSTRLKPNKLVKRGDLVKYNGAFYFWQGNGNMSYLYKRREDVGMTKRAIEARRTSIRPATAEERMNFLPTDES